MIHMEITEEESYLTVVVSQMLRSNNTVEVRLHQLLYDCKGL